MTLEDVPEVKFTKNLGSGVSAGDCKISQIGRLISAQISCTTSSDINAWTSRNIGKLNCTLKDAVSATTFSVNKQTNCRYRIEADGTVKIVRDGGAVLVADNIEAQSVFFIADTVTAESN